MAATLISMRLMAQKTPSNAPTTQEASLIVGRVLADVSTLASGSGLGPKHAVFIFGVEEDRGTHVAPVKISYAFFKSEGPPPDSFFDHSKRYELQAARDPKCDESVNSLAYVKNVDESGKPLAPSYVLRVLDGAPKDVLKLDAVLPCYVLRPGKYRVLSQKKDGTPSAPTTR